MDQTRGPRALLPRRPQALNGVAHSVSILLNPLLTPALRIWLDSKVAVASSFGSLLPRLRPGAVRVLVAHVLKLRVTEHCGFKAASTSWLVRTAETCVAAVPALLERVIGNTAVGDVGIGSGSFCMQNLGRCWPLLTEVRLPGIQWIE